MAQVIDVVQPALFTTVPREPNRPICWRTEQNVLILSPSGDKFLISSSVLL